jgi:hypothetical protein
MKLFLDATDVPPGDRQGWTIVRTVDEAIERVLDQGFPVFVSFNNDLGKDETEGNEFAFWLIEHDLDAGAMPDDFGYEIRGHSPDGDDRIRTWIDGHLAERAAAKVAGLRWPRDLHKIPAAATEAENSDRITFEICCELILEHGPPDRKLSNPDYRRDLLALLNKEFGIDWTDNDEALWNSGVPRIAGSVARCYAEVADPFAGWLEYTPVKGEDAVWKTHQAGVIDATTIIRQRLVAFFRDLLLLRWPEAAGRSTSWSRLQELGLVRPDADADDF